MSWIYMRDEMRSLIHGDRHTIAQGRWVVVRIFRRGELSEYWSEEHSEAINGPRWKYDDHLVKTISYPTSKFSRITREESGIDVLSSNLFDITGTYVFALEYNPKFARFPIEKDIIYHIDKYSSKRKPVPPIKAMERFSILDSFPDYGDHGQAEMIICIAERRHGEG